MNINLLFVFYGEDKIVMYEIDESVPAITFVGFK